MRRLLLLLTLTALTGCVYVTKGEFEEYWDPDKDKWPLGTGPDDDCDSQNALIHPYAADVRGDGCDADCGKESDLDGDDWPDDADCDPEDPERHPWSPFEEPGDGEDFDCDGDDDVRTDSPGDGGVCADCDPDFAPEEQEAISPDQCGNPAPNAPSSE